MPTVYRRDDPGAPAITYGNSTAAVINALFSVLKTCLVSGYAGKPAAGWELIAEQSSTYLVLRNGAGSGYFAISWESNGLWCYLSKTFTGMSGVRPAGEGLKSGTSAGLSARQKLNVGAFSHSGSGTWTVMADERTFILTASGNSAGATPLPYTGQVSMVNLYGGEDSNGNMICIGGTNTDNTNIQSNYFSAGGTAGFTTLYDPETGLLVDTAAISVHAPSLGTPGLNTSYRMINVPELPLAKVPWGKVGAPFAGFIRGIATCQLFLQVPAGYIAQSLGVPGLNSRNGNTPIDFGDGHFWMVGPPHGDVVPFLSTDNPEFW